MANKSSSKKPASKKPAGSSKAKTASSKAAPSKSKSAPSKSKAVAAPAKTCGIKELIAGIDKKTVRAFINEWAWAITLAVIGLALIIAALCGSCESCQNCGACKAPSDDIIENTFYTSGSDTSASDVSFTDTSADTTAATSTTTTAATTTTTAAPPSKVPSGEHYTNAADGMQLNPPAEGEQIAVIETSMGTVKLRLFPDQAPLACQNFVTLVNQGYYNGLIFHRVINDFMIQGGDPTGTGSGGDSCWGEDFAIESGRNLYNFRGALCMANTGQPNSNSSQFYIVQAPPVTDYTADDLVSYGWPQWAADEYIKNGGAYGLDSQAGGAYTVFGQAFEGMDVVDAIAGVETNDSDKPVSDVTINKIYMDTYKAA